MMRHVENLSFEKDETFHMAGFSVVELSGNNGDSFIDMSITTADRDCTECVGLVEFINNLFQCSSFLKVLDLSYLCYFRINIPILFCFEEKKHAKA